MKYTRFFLFILLNTISCLASSGDDIGFHPPILSAEKILEYVDLYDKEDKIGLENYKLTKLSYSYNAQEWYLTYKDKKDKFNSVTILINDINPSSYQVFTY